MTATSTITKASSLDKLAFDRAKRKRLKEGKTNEFAIPKGFGCPNYIVPSWQMTAFLEKHRDTWQAQHAPLQTTTKELTFVNANEGEGWKTVLSHQLGLILNKHPDTVTRRVYDYAAGKTQIALADYADAMCITLGLHLEYDAGFTVLPGARRLAADMIEAKAEFIGETTSPEELIEMSNRLMWLSWKIVTEPENHDALVKQAPFDVLRPY